MNLYQGAHTGVVITKLYNKRLLFLLPWPATSAFPLTKTNGRKSTFFLSRKWQVLPTQLLQPVTSISSEKRLLWSSYRADNVRCRQAVIYVTGFTIKSNRKSNQSFLSITLGSEGGIQPWWKLDKAVRDPALASDSAAEEATSASTTSTLHLHCLILGTSPWCPEDASGGKYSSFPSVKLSLGFRCSTLQLSSVRSHPFRSPHSLETLQRKIFLILNLIIQNSSFFIDCGPKRTAQMETPTFRTSKLGNTNSLRFPQYGTVSSLRKLFKYPFTKLIKIYRPSKEKCLSMK